MKYAVFSDVHSNIESLDVVLRFYEKYDIDYYLFCGDIVGYNPNPNECVARLKDIKNLYAVLGNHDAFVVGKKSIRSFNKYAAEVLLWTEKVLIPENKTFVNGFPYAKVINDITIVHGSPTHPLEEYVFSVEQCLANIDKFNTKICFIGHTHEPLVFGIDEEKKFVFNVLKFDNDKYEVQLEEKMKYIINVGSVGQPRDGNNKSCCVIYDDAMGVVTFFRLKYDYQITQKKIKELNFPPFIGNRLALGH